RPPSSPLFPYTTLFRSYLILLGLGVTPGPTTLNEATFALAAGSLIGSASLLPAGLGAAEGTLAAVLDLVAGQPRDVAAAATLLRSEEHTSELQSPCNIV